MTAVDVPELDRGASPADAVQPQPADAVQPRPAEPVEVADQPTDPAAPQPAGPSADLAALADEYLSLARLHAASGDTRGAVLATWAADVLALQTLLWESGLGSAPDPDAELLAVGEAVLATVAQHAAAPGAPATPRALVEDFRHALVAAFDPSVHALLDGRLASLGHLDGLDVPAAGTAGIAAAARLEGSSAEQLAWDLRLAASDCTTVAAALERAGDSAEAARQRTAADTASFEAHLLHAAVAAGDEHLCTVDLRWDLVASRLAGPTTSAEGHPALRTRMLDALLPAERASLTELFAQTERR